MSNHMIVWNGWIFPAKAREAALAGPTRSEMTTFERIVLANRAKPTPPIPQVATRH